MATPPALLVPRPDARAILGGVAERTFARLEAEGILTPSRRGRGGRASVYDVRQIVPAYIAYLAAAPASGDERQARTRAWTAQAELNELRIAERQGKLVLRDQVIAEGRTYAQAAKGRLLSMAHQLVQRGIIPAEAETPVREVVREALTDLSGVRPPAPATKTA